MRRRASSRRRFGVRGGEAADLEQAEMTHRLVVDVDGYAEGGVERPVVLHAFNHAPREMGAAACDAEQRRHAQP